MCVYVCSDRSNFQCLKPVNVRNTWGQLYPPHKSEDYKPMVYHARPCGPHFVKVYCGLVPKSAQ